MIDQLKCGLRPMVLLGVWLLAIDTGVALAQTALPATRVSATAKDARFQVDGFWFTGSAIFTWPAGSKHVLTIDSWQFTSGVFKARSVFQHWNTAAGPLASSNSSVVVTADAGIPWYNADLAIQYAVSLNFFRCGDPPCAGPGTVWVNQIPYQEDADVWADAASTVLMEASPGPGYLFAGWMNGTSAPLFSFVLNAPVTVYPRFATARAIQLNSSPDGLQFLADRAPVYPPISLDWGWNTVHTLTAPSPQRDAAHGRLWVFQSWSDGGAASHTYKVEPGLGQASVTAVFAPAVIATVLTEPAGLTLTADGQTVASPHTWYWAAGESHTLTAPARQVDAAGGPWIFRAWSNGGSNPQTVVTTGDQVDAGFRATAIYDPVSRIRVESVPSGLALTVDGTACQTPCELERAVGATVRLSAPASFATGAGARLEFTSWEGTDAAVFAAVAGYRKITAHYATSYLLTLTTTPDNAGSWRVSPANADGYYRAGAAVTLGFDAAAGMRFAGWGLDLSGTSNPVSLSIDAPLAVRAMMERIPSAPPPPRVVNAAGETPVAGVAPGSLATLFGENLASGTAQSQTIPLPQTLAGVTLQCGGRYVALLFVSPQQINFQVPGDLQPGSYTLEIDHSGAPIRRVALEVVRNAPGLFAVAHLDGTVVNTDAPAARGETILVYGTGFGAYPMVLADGFPVPAAPALPVVDEATVLLASAAIMPEFAGAVPGAVGLAMIRVRIPNELDAMPSAGLTVQIGTHSSNTLNVPIQ